MIAAEAPASSANLGPAFDTAAVALDLWNRAEIGEGAFAVELDGEGADELPRDASHLSIRAFAVFASPDRYRFRFTNCIPLERGLGSSAAAIALGLVAGAAAAGRDVRDDELLAAARRFENHLDNLAAAILGGVCASWEADGEPRARRLADDMPAAAIAVVPNARTSTVASRTALPAHVPHADAAASAGAALLLGAAVVSGDAALLEPALRDRLHEPYRAHGAPLLEAVRRHAPADALGVTLSGSGPSVIVWVPRGREEAVAARLESSLGAGVAVRRLAVASTGARATAAETGT